MNKVHFIDGVKPLTSDMNDLHNFTEDGVYELLKAIGGSTGKLLFNPTEPTTSILSSVLYITVPSQYFAIGGAVTSVVETSISYALSADTYIGVYFVLKKDPIQEERNFLSLDDPSNILILQDLTATVRYEDLGRVVFTRSSTSTIAEPLLGETDVDFVQLGYYSYTHSSTTLVYTPNESDVFSLPAGIATAVPGHGLTHIKGAADAIPDANINSGVTGGSTSGLLPEGGLTAVLGSIQEVAAATDSTYIQLSEEGTNAVDGNGIDSRTLTIGIRTDESLTTVADSEGDAALGLNFLPASVLNGISDRPARVGHLHSLSQMGVILHSLSVDMNSFSDYGTVIGPFTVSSTNSGGSGVSDVGRILNISVTWLPPGVSDNSHYGVSCDWSIINDPLPASIGCRAIIASSNTFYLEIGEQGFAYLTQATINKINQNSNPQWAFGNYATSGKIRMDVMAARIGSFTNTVEVVS